MTSKLISGLKQTRNVLTTAAAVLAAAIVVIETYDALCKKVDAARGS